MSVLDTQDAPALGFGHTHHARRWPAKNAFTTSTVFIRLPMRSLMTQPAQRLGRLFGINLWSAIGFRDQDHGLRHADHGSALRWVDALLANNGIVDCTGQVWLHTFPAVLGYAFKPVSFWFCERNNGDVGAVLVEVNNTFGEHHHYVLRGEHGAALHNGDHLFADKAFHVSPFFPVRGRYEFSWKLNPNHSLLRIDYRDEAHRPEIPDEITLITTINGVHTPITVSTCLRALLTYPAQAVTVVVRIHWQALKLWAKRVPFYSKPTLPKQPVTHSALQTDILKK
jgi:uncharacterized protein